MSLHIVDRIEDTGLYRIPQAQDLGYFQGPYFNVWRHLVFTFIENKDALSIILKSDHSWDRKKVMLFQYEFI